MPLPMPTSKANSLLNNPLQPNKNRLCTVVSGDNNLSMSGQYGQLLLTTISTATTTAGAAVAALKLNRRRKPTTTTIIHITLLHFFFYFSQHYPYTRSE
ncbi:hypothetical protein HanXRQr2_Chr09g0406141 [Helianthus annuus]|uniref:Uncharacterized protein n=1 Tax=Helianthus annuus TaxID=4232 RepID=A0A9K3I8K3_HELAN|nr:hypothetical protein HanXRQr2_Chr09g0406141 [Helianthus annuus]KAJ0894710.1 hypothetical protein HanPSC8_Chr09g0392051 [Helianthus annuus]